MITLPIDIGALADAARSGFAAAMLDDPTLWPEGAAVLPGEVSRAACEVVRDNFRSTLARSIGAHIQNIATDMDLAISEDGPLADLAEVWGRYVVGLDLEDYSTIVAAPDWEARVEALKTLAGEVLAGAPAPAPSRVQIDAYIAADPRLADLATAQRVGASVPAGDFLPPEPAAPSAVSWDDEDEEETAPPPKAAALSVPAGDVRPMPLLFHLLEPIGVLLTDLADVTGINKPTLSTAKNGKRPWQGLTEKQAYNLAVELEARAEAATALARRLRALEPAVVDGNRG